MLFATYVFIVLHVGKEFPENNDNYSKSNMRKLSL